MALAQRGGWRGAIDRLRCIEREISIKSVVGELGLMPHRGAKTARVCYNLDSFAMDGMHLF